MLVWTTTGATTWLSSADLDENLVQKSFGKLNARIAIAGNDQWQVSVVGKNLLSEDTFMWGNDIPLGSLGFNGAYFKTNRSTAHC